MMRKIYLILGVLLTIQTASGQIYKDSLQPVEMRVRDLLSRMTPEEKFWQLFMIPGDLGDNADKYKTGIFGFQVNAAGQNTDAGGQLLQYKTNNSAYETTVKINSIQKYFIEQSRLGIPIIAFDEALHGLVRSGATVFPQSIGLAATWNPELVHNVSEAIADECSSRGIRQILSPVVNIASDVRWGRTEETYGEDPFLASEMSVAFVSAFEKKGIITTPKHFAANVGDGGRDSYPIYFNERYMREVILPPFEACIKRGGSSSVMTSYNSYNGTPSSANDWLLNRLLKKEWGFQGFVISDACAAGGANVLHLTASDYPDASAKSINGGLDVIFQTEYDHHTLFDPPFYDGRIQQQTIDDAVARVLRSKFELGLFEKPYADSNQAKQLNGNTRHRELAKKAALESIVLLKNKDNVLPLSKSIRSIAVIGPDADTARLGGYSGPGNNKVSILKGIQNLVGKNVKVNYSKGCERETIEYVTIPSTSLACTIDGEKREGLKGDYYNNITFSGSPVFTRCDQQIQFQWTLYSPDPTKLPYDFYSVRWTGTVQSPETGTYHIGIDGNDGYRLYIDGKLVIDNWVKRSKQRIVSDHYFEKGKEYAITIEYYEPTGNARVNFVWNVGVHNNSTQEFDGAVEAVSKSDVAVVVVGIVEGEGLDRAYLTLPGKQEELINRIASIGKPTIVVLVGGSAVIMNSWIHNVGAILDVWYPGESGGDAVADVFFGDYNPAGRLPITFPVFEGQLPLVYNHTPTGRLDDYGNLTGQPLFPFGYGLSYTQFEYGNAKLGSDIITTGDSTYISVNVTNTGTVTGDEVVQLYLHDEVASVARPVTELKGFKRINLKPGETKEVRFTINPEMLTMLDITMKKVVEPGDFRIMIGSSSKDIRIRKVLKVEDQ